MTGPIVLSEELRHQILNHCMGELPNEGCGLLAIDGNRVAKVYPTRNEDASPVSYTVPPQEHYDALIDAEERGWALGGVFHSHPRGPAGMSPTDVTRAFDPNWVYLVVNLAEEEPTIAGWRQGQDVPLE